MSGQVVRAEPLTREAFAPFGTVIEASGASFPINGGTAERFHDLARVDVDGAAAISLVLGQSVAWPVAVGLVERHPLGSQAWIPLGGAPFLVVAAPDQAGRPGRPRAFLTAPGQGVSYRRGAWHGVLTPLGRPQLFAVVDRAEAAGNLEEHHFAEPWTVTAA